MAARTIFLTGATGLVGGRLCEALLADGHHVRALSRAGPRGGAVPGLEWVGGDVMQPAAWRDALAGVDAVVHLAGESVAGGRWTASRKRLLIESRVAGTRNILDGLRDIAARPRVLVCASACGYYGPRGEEVLEEGAAPGDDFLARLCVEWEAAARAGEALGLRVVSLRFGMVLARAGGALPRMLPLFRMGLGGPLGPADRYVPWVHLDDAAGAAQRALEEGPSALSGPLNVVAPEAVRMGTFARALGRALRRPALLPVPLLALRAVLGEATDAVVPGQHVVPAALRAGGYGFRHPELDEALRDLLGAGD